MVQILNIIRNYLVVSYNSGQSRIYFRRVKIHFYKHILPLGNYCSQNVQNMKGVIIIKKAIKAKKQPVDQIKELEISGQSIGKLTVEMKNTLEQCKNLESLNMCECDLTSLDNLPNFKNLVELDLSTNSITDGEVWKLEKYTNLKFLSLADNKIAKLQTLKKLSIILVNIQRLQCADNEIQELPNYFKTVFAMFPKLVELDHRDPQGKEVDTADFGEQGDQGDQGDQDDQGQEDFDDEAQNYPDSGQEGEEQDDNEQFDEEGEDGQEDGDDQDGENEDSEDDKKNGKK